MAPLLPDASQRERIANALTMKPVVLDMPTRGNDPIFPFLFAKAFPTLFPNGDGDFFAIGDRSTVRHLSFTEWVHHLLQFKDGRFAKHPRFTYMAFNMQIRKRANQVPYIYIIFF
eukprot:GHVR01080163.1.p1 GENE.GHVR01080163.1~~GHVR01080163.1.p1  ORF type:complete len:115 (+),score=4.62 GHVR01080163.1:250-594(+)